MDWFLYDNGLRQERVNYRSSNHVVFVKPRQQYCHSNLVGNISKLDYLDEEFKQVIAVL